mmetsp:Transcript_12776/g.37975  ORF Transcript_12776/g.37975 Transcript_12776/m.37975 type:complete len:306 (+) Transcript_12776:324-1241(+)
MDHEQQPRRLHPRRRDPPRRRHPAGPADREAGLPLWASPAREHPGDLELPPGAHAAGPARGSHLHLSGRASQRVWHHRGGCGAWRWGVQSAPRGGRRRFGAHLGAFAGQCCEAHAAPPRRAHACVVASSAVSGLRGPRPEEGSPRLQLRLCSLPAAAALRRGQRAAGRQLRVRPLRESRMCPGASRLRPALGHPRLRGRRTGPASGRAGSLRRLRGAAGEDRRRRNLRGQGVPPRPQRGRPPLLLPRDARRRVLASVARCAMPRPGCGVDAVPPFEDLAPRLRGNKRRRERGRRRLGPRDDGGGD